MTAQHFRDCPSASREHYARGGCPRCDVRGDDDEERTLLRRALSKHLRLLNARPSGPRSVPQRPAGHNHRSRGSAHRSDPRRATLHLDFIPQTGVPVMERMRRQVVYRQGRLFWVGRRRRLSVLVIHGAVLGEQFGRAVAVVLSQDATRDEDQRFGIALGDRVEPR